MKACRKCRVERPLSDFSKRASSPDGLNTRCRACVKEASRRRYVEKREHILETNRRWREENPEYFRTQSAQWYVDNKERAAASWVVRRDTETPEQRAHRLAVGRAWRKANPDRVSAYQAHREVVIKAGNAGEYVDYEVVRERDTSCYLCAVAFLPEDDTHFDHKIPICRGGEHTYENVALTHAVCNLRKNNRTPEEYWEYLRLGAAS